MHDQTERQSQVIEENNEQRLPYEAPAIIHRSPLEVHAAVGKTTLGVGGCSTVTS